MTDLITKQIQSFTRELAELRAGSSDRAVFCADLLAWNLRLSELALRLQASSPLGWPLEDLRQLNAGLYAELLPEAYARSWANPVHAVSRLGPDGAACSALYYRMRQLVDFAFRGELALVAAFNELALGAADLCRQGRLEAKTVADLIKRHAIEQAIPLYQYQLGLTMDPSRNRFTQLMAALDPSDERGLYVFGSRVSDCERRTARFLAELSEARVATMAESLVKAYIAGFKRDNKDISLRHTVQVVAVLGQERLSQAILKALEARELRGHIGAVTASEANKQADYDHKFDIGLYLDGEFLDRRLAALEAAGSACAGFMRDYSGILYIEKFGEEPFSPLPNAARVTLGQEQNARYQQLVAAYRQTLETFVPETESSFCIIAYPTPEIGKDFEAIFDAVCAINSLNSDRYEKIQQALIAALDRGRQVQVKGVAGNDTDITVRLTRLADPARQSNFVNCVADVNVPVGEVFTSPVLEGTNGVLHVEDIYLNDFRFLNLKLWFKDGMVTDYACTNFADREANRKYIEENLLFPHRSLPLGEFAIGTNTLAYTMARRFGIQEKLPVLIIEKMGPHFAIGDTCFNHAEDHPVFNPLDGKEVVARTNSVAELRHSDPDKAYTNVHIDITLPYDSLDRITVFGDTGGGTDLIRGGRFVLPGTEELNAAFEM